MFERDGSRIFEWLVAVWQSSWWLDVRLAESLISVGLVSGCQSGWWLDIRVACILLLDVRVAGDW